MFQWFKKKQQQNNQAYKTDNITSSSVAKKRFTYQLQSLSGVTQNDFQSLYLATINNFERYLTTHTQAENIDVQNKALVDVVFALKKRQGYLLPAGSDSETSFREREEWTFAIFAGALLKEVDHSNRFNIAKIILPTQAFSWLSRNKKLFELWKDYLSGVDNCFAEIIDASCSLQLEANKEFMSAQLAPALEILIEKQILPSVKSEDKNLVVRKTELTAFNKQDFWQWLRHALEKKLLPVNQTDSLVHGVELGLLLVFPKIIDAFYSDQFKQLEIVRQKITLAERIALSKKIKKHECLMRTAKGSRIHFYCLDKWEDRNVISGIVIKPKDFLFDLLFEFSVNRTLSVDPIFHDV